MIKTYPVKIELYDDVDDPVAIIESFDEHTCNVSISALLGRGNMEEVCEAIKAAIFTITEK